MCGIVYVKRKDGRAAYKAVLKRYRHQKARGQNGFGYVAIKDDKVVSYQRASTEHEIVKLLEKETAPEIMFHHRYPTSTPNIEEAAHPILVENDMLQHQYFVLHNGVIKNTKELREAHYKLGIEYTTEIMKGFIAVSTQKQYTTEIEWNDSESIAVETALAMEGLKKTIDTEGAAAVVGVQTRGDQVVNRFFYRNDNHPLMFNEDKVMVTLTSLGGGTMLPATLLYRLKKEGGFSYYGNEIENKEGIPVPKGYTYTTPTYNGTYNVRRDSKFYEEHEWDRDLKDWVLKASIIELESTSPLMGFNVGMKRMSDFLLPARERDETPVFDFGDPSELDLDDDDLFGEAETGIKRLDEISTDLGVIKKRLSKGLDFIEKLPLTVLWTEYNDAVDIETTLKEVIAQMDIQIKDFGDNDEMVEQKEKVTQQKQEVTEYIGKLSVEITTRESIDKSMERMYR